MLQLMIATLLNPRLAAPQVFRWAFGHNELVLAAALVAALSGLHGGISRLLVPLPEEFENLIIATPIGMAIIQLVSIFVVAALIYRVGRAFGGHGDYLNALKTTVWVSLAGLALALISLVMMLVAPILAQMFELATVFWMFFIFAVFIQQLHGFESLFTTMAGAFGTLLVVAIGVATALAVLGVMPVGVEP